MPDLIKKNYKIVLYGILILISIFILPISAEIIFKLGNIVGTYIRTFGTSVCF